MSSRILKRMRRHSTTALGTVLVALMSCGLAAAEDHGDRDDAAHREDRYPDQAFDRTYRRESDLRPHLCHLSAEARPVGRQPAVEGHHSPVRGCRTEFRAVAAVPDKPALSVEIFHRR